MTLIKSRNSAREATTPQTAQELTLVLSTIRAWKYLRGALRFNMFPLYYTLIWSYAQVTRFISMWWYKFYYSNFGADLLRFIIIAFLLAITETSSSVKIATIIFRGVSCGRGVAKYINMRQVGRSRYRQVIFFRGPPLDPWLVQSPAFRYLTSALIFGNVVCRQDVSADWNFCNHLISSLNED